MQFLFLCKCFFLHLHMCHTTAIIRSATAGTWTFLQQPASWSCFKLYAAYMPLGFTTCMFKETPCDVCDICLLLGYWASCLQAGAHVVGGPPCSSWVWLSRGSTKRCRLRPQGCKRHPGVRKSNKLARRLLYLHLASTNRNDDTPCMRM